MKFNRLRYPGLFILKEGKIEIEDDRGFRCRDIMSPRDYFGENLLIHSQGFQNYGRMVVSSPTATFYLLNTNKLLWAFTSLDVHFSLLRNKRWLVTLRNVLKSKLYVSSEIVSVNAWKSK
jgi:hypothetical protein